MGQIWELIILNWQDTPTLWLTDNAWTKLFTLFIFRCIWPTSLYKQRSRYSRMLGRVAGKDNRKLTRGAAEVLLDNCTQSWHHGVIQGRWLTEESLTPTTVRLLLKITSATYNVLIEVLEKYWQLFKIICKDCFKFYPTANPLLSLSSRCHLNNKENLPVKSHMHVVTIFFCLKNEFFVRNFSLNVKHLASVRCPLQLNLP